jgi:hypothetical protein
MDGIRGREMGTQKEKEMVVGRKGNDGRSWVPHIDVHRQTVEKAAIATGIHVVDNMLLHIFMQKYQ